MTASKREVLSYVQMEMMIAELERKPALISGKITGDVTKHSLSTMWNEIARIVSVLPGCIIDGEALKKRFSQLRCRVKTKAANNRLEIQRSGEKARIQPLTPLEERLLQLVGQDFIYGIGENQELGHNENHNSESTKIVGEQPSSSIELTKDISALTENWNGKKEIDSSQCIEPTLALSNGLMQEVITPDANDIESLENSNGPSSLIPLTEHTSFIIAEELNVNSHTIGLIDNSILNEHSSSQDNSLDEEQMMNQETLNGCKRKRKQPMTIEELKIKIMTEILEAERIRKETEKIRQDKERYCKETERLRKWQLTQQCIKGGYGLPPSEFQ